MSCPRDHLPRARRVCGKHKQDLLVGVVSVGEHRHFVAIAEFQAGVEVRAHQEDVLQFAGQHDLDRAAGNFFQPDFSGKPRAQIDARGDAERSTPGSRRDCVCTPDLRQSGPRPPRAVAGAATRSFCRSKPQNPTADRAMSRRRVAQMLAAPGIGQIVRHGDQRFDSQQQEHFFGRTADFGGLRSVRHGRLPANASARVRLRRARRPSVERAARRTRAAGDPDLPAACAATWAPPPVCRQIVDTRQLSPAGCGIIVGAFRTAGGSEAGRDVLEPASLCTLGRYRSQKAVRKTRFIRGVMVRGETAASQFSQACMGARCSGWRTPRTSLFNS